MTTGISFTEFDRALAKLGLQGPQRIAVAVSGGGDSLALALLLQEWQRSKGGDLLALTVDHGLRENSAQEAKAVQLLLQKQGIAHEILHWQGNKPASGVQEMAREPLYALLLEACRAKKFPLLAVAHNLEDQAETFWMRLAHGSGLDGLAGMSPARAENGVAILRPLLSFPRARLRDTCKRFNIQWIEDPSNRNEKFLRAKLRPFEALLAEEGLSPARLAQTMQKLEDARQALEEMTAAAQARCLTLHDTGYAALDKKIFAEAPAEIQRRILLQTLMILSPAPYPAGADAVEDLRQALHDTAFAGRTLAGCDIFPQGGNILFAREAAAAEGRKPLCESLLWDGRFAISGFESQTGIEIGAAGENGLAELRKNPEAAKKMESLPFKVKRVLPALWQGENLLAVPHLSYYGAACPLPLRQGRLLFRGTFSAR